MRRYPVVLVSLGILLLLGCALRMSQREQKEMDSFVGKLTYRAAMTRWGVPFATRQNAEELTAVWREQSSQTVDVGGRNPRYCGAGLGDDGGCVGSPGVAPGTTTVRSGYQRTLVFDRKTQVLKSWDYQYW